MSFIQGIDLGKTMGQEPESPNQEEKAPMVRLTGAPVPARTGPDEEFYRADEKVWVPGVQVKRHVWIQAT